jgi:ferric-dicitrate binding protein FerR (iron transport regulator)
MNCAKAARWTSEYADGALDADKSARLERHLESCPACRELLRDFRAMARDARRLDAPKIPAQAWTRIRARLRDGAAVPLGDKRPAFATSPLGGRRFAFVAASLALIVVAVAALFFSLRKGKDLVVEGPNQQEQRTLAKLDEAERYYELAVKSLGEALAGEKGRLSPEVAEMFEKSLEVVDATIQACRQAVRSEPDNVQTRDYLLAAYKEKIVLMGDLLDMNRKSLPKEELGQAL